VGSYNNRIIYIDSLFYLEYNHIIRKSYSITIYGERERIARTLNCEETDKLPVDFGGTVVTCIDYHAHIKLKNHFGIKDAESDRIIDYTMGTVELCEEIVFPKQDGHVMIIKKRN